MKQQLIKTSKATILVVDLPEGVTAPRIENFKNYSSLFSGESSICRLPPGNWQLLGKTFEMSDEQWKEIVEEEVLILSWDKYSDSPITETMTATESGISLLTANKVFKENPNEKPDIQYFMSDSAFTKRDYHEKLNQWQEAEQHVYRNAYTLIKK